MLKVAVKFSFLLYGIILVYIYLHILHSFNMSSAASLIMTEESTLYSMQHDNSLVEESHQNTPAENMLI